MELISGATPLSHEKHLKQSPEPQQLLWASMSRDEHLMDSETKKDVNDKLERPTLKIGGTRTAPHLAFFQKKMGSFCCVFETPCSGGYYDPYPSFGLT